MNRNKRIIFLDGATGTILMNRGLNPTPVSNIETPEIVKEIHKDYILSGADIIETNTFSVTPAKYKNYRKINVLGVELAKKAVKESGRKNVKIAGSLGATGLMVKPLGKLDFEDAVKNFKSQASVLNNGGVDLIIIETMDDILEMKAALIAVKETISEIPVIATMTFNEDGITSTGTSAEIAAAVMDTLGAEVIGVNCSFGPVQMVDVIKRMRQITKKPLIAQPNAGLPVLKNGMTIYPVGPEEYSKGIKRLVSAGAGYIGGCCGTTPAHIKLLIKKLGKINPKSLPDTDKLLITSRTDSVEISKNGPPVIIGERINFIAHKELIESNEKIIAEGIRQKKAGAQALDVNLGRFENKSLEVVELLEKKVTLPIVLDMQNHVYVEEIVRRYPGILLLNSISGEEKKLEELMPIAKKYGIPFIGLCLDEHGVPRNINDKLKIYRKIIRRAKGYKVNTNKIIADPLTFAAGSDHEAGAKTLKALSLISHNTLLGVSNVSMGLPMREVFNRSFSVMAVYAGCSAMIVNPCDIDLIDGIYASSLLAGREKFSGRVKKHFLPAEKEFSFKSILSQAILDGNTQAASAETTELLKKTEAMKIVKENIVPALDKVGEHYKHKKIFLPQLIESAQTAQKVMEQIQSSLASTGKVIKNRGKIVIATVKGDIHDIGKNLVTLILRNHMFEVLDLGVDVSSQTIVNEANKFQADLIALSSLMTTTMGKMKEIQEIILKTGKKIPVVIGGAAVTKKFADSIGASYGRDAIEAVRVADEIVKR